MNITLCVGEVGLEGGGMNITLCVGEVGLEESQTDIHRLSTASRLALFSRKQNSFFETQTKETSLCNILKFSNHHIFSIKYC